MTNESRPHHPILIIAALAAAAAALALASSGAPDQASAQGLGGRWTTLASGDDILSLLRDGGTVWAGTRSGGLVRWDTVTGEYEQYLRPQDGLGGNTVFDMALDEGGRLWLATDGGLTVFEPAAGRPQGGSGGDRWFTYTTETGLGMPSDEVRAVAVRGSLVYVGGVQRQDPVSGEWWGGGLGRVDTKGTFDPQDDEWAPIATFESTYRQGPGGLSEPGLVSDTVNDILVTPAGNVWVAASPHWRFETGPDPEGPPSWQRRHGGLSFLDTRGTPQTADDRWSGFSCELLQLTVTCSVRRLALDPRGRAWAADGGRGLIHFDPELGQLGGPQARLVPPPEEGDGFVLDLAFGPVDVPQLANTVWMATRTGGVVVLDHKGTLANRGDDVWNFDRGDPLDVHDGLAGMRVQAIVAGQGRMWLGHGAARGAGGGLQALDTATLEALPAWRTVRAPPSNFITDIAFGGPGSRWQDHVWIATGARGGATGARLFGSGVAVVDTGGGTVVGDFAWTHHDARSSDDDGALPWTGLASDNVQAVAVHGDDVWLGTAETRWDRSAGRYADGGLSVFDGRHWTARRPAAGSGTGLGAGGVSALAVGCDGELWVATGNTWDHAGTGVYVRAAGAPAHETAGESWTRHNFPQLASTNSTSLAVDCGRRTVFVGAMHHVNSAETGGPVGQWSGGGLAAFELDLLRWTRTTVDNGLQSFASGAIKGEVASLAVAADGRLLAGAFGTRGMSSSALVATRPYWPAVFNERSEGTWSAAVFERAGMVASIAEDLQGRPWAATSRGGLARDSVSPDNWAAGDDAGGLFVRADGEWLRLTARQDGIPSNDASVIRRAPDGSMWVGSAGWGLAFFDPRAAPRTPTPALNLPTRTPSPTRDPSEATPTLVLTPATVAPPWPSPTHQPTSTLPGPGTARAWLPAVFTHGHGPPRPPLTERAYLPFVMRPR